MPRNLKVGGTRECTYMGLTTSKRPSDPELPIRQYTMYGSANLLVSFIRGEHTHVRDVGSSMCPGIPVCMTLREVPAQQRLILPLPMDMNGGRYFCLCLGNKYLQIPTSQLKVKHYSHVKSSRNQTRW